MDEYEHDQARSMMNLEVESHEFLVALIDETNDNVDDVHPRIVENEPEINLTKKFQKSINEKKYSTMSLSRRSSVVRLVRMDVSNRRLDIELC
jgi:hypothetical protein